MFLLGINLLIAICSSQSVLTSINISNLATNQLLPNNFLGVSLAFPLIYDTAFTSTLFKNYLTNSWVFDSTSASWGISLKMQYPVGFKYNCPTLWDPIVTNYTCTADVSTYYPAIGDFLRASANNYRGLSVGYDREALDFTDVSTVDALFWYSSFDMDWWFGIDNVAGG